MQAQFYIPIQCNGCRRSVDGITDHGVIVKNKIFFKVFCPLCGTRKMVAIDKRDLIEHLEEVE